MSWYWNGVGMSKRATVWPSEIKNTQVDIDGTKPDRRPFYSPIIAQIKNQELENRAKKRRTKTKLAKVSRRKNR